MTSPACAWPSRSSAASTSRSGITLEAAVGLGINPILTFGTDEQKQTWLPGPGRGTQARRLRADRAGRRLRRRAPRRPRPSCATASGWSTAASSSSPTPAPRSPAWSPSPPRPASGRTGRPEISTIIVPSDTEGFTAEKAYDKLGWHASDTHPLSFSDARVPGVQPAGRARARLRAVPGHPRRRPRRDRRAGGRLHPGLPRHEPASTPASGPRSAYPSGASRAWPSRSPTSR